MKYEILCKTKNKILRLDNNATFNFPNKNLIVAVDQSTSSVGIAVLTKDKKLLINIDIINHNLSVYEMQSLIVHFIKKFENTLTTVIIEDVYNYNNVLVNLRNIIKKNIKGVICVKPSVWRKYFLGTKNTNASRIDIKLLVINEVLNLYPELNDYSKLIAKDKDSLEAVGIGLGYLNAQDSINTIMPKYKGNIYLKVIKPSELKKEEGMVLFNYNKDMTLEENARRAISCLDSNEVAISVIPITYDYIIYAFERNEPITEDTEYIMYAKKGVL